jgi:hypothetical protein
LTFDAQTLTISNTASSTNAGISVNGRPGTNAGVFNLAIAGANNSFIEGAVAGDTAFRGSNKVHISSGAGVNAAANYPGGITVSGTYVGITCNDPQYTLDVNGTARIVGLTTLGNALEMGTAASWTSGRSNTLYGDTASVGTKYIRWTYNNTPGTTIADGANMNLASPLVGINQSAPTAQLHVRTSGNVAPGDRWDSKWMIVTPAANSATAGDTPALGFGYNVASNTAHIAAVEPYVAWRNLQIDASNILFKTSNIERVRITDGGNVGVGTATPAYTLDVNGNQQVKANGSSNTSFYGTTYDTLTLRTSCNQYEGGIASIFFGNTAPNYPLARIYAQDAQPDFGGAYKSRLVFQTNDVGLTLVERMRIDANGYMGILTNSPSTPLEIATTIPGSIYLNNAAPSGYVKSTNTNNTATAFGSNNFTIEFWVYPTTIYPAAWTTWFSVGIQTGEIRISQNQGESGFIGVLYPPNNVSQPSSVTATLNAWRHVALVRSGATMQLYYGGTRIVNVTSGVSFSFDNSGYIWLGRNPYGDTTPNTHIAGLRIAKSALYASGATITVPSVPLLPIDTTSLLMNMYIGTPLYDSVNNTAFQFVDNCYQTSLVPNGTYSTANTSLVNGTLCVSNYTPQTTTTTAGSIAIVGRMPTLGGEFGEGVVSTTYAISNYGGGVYGGLTQGVGGFLAFGTNTFGTTTERMRIKHTGNVGIATNNPVTTLDVNGGFTVRNGYRPLFSNVTGSGPITTSRTSYGTHYYLTNSAFSAVTLAVPDTAADLNAYWVFRNATGTYLSVTFTWPTIGVAPVPSVNVFSIPPSNAMTVMFVSSNSGGGNFGFYTSSNYWAVF